MASSSMSEHCNPLQQRAAAAAQALLAPGRSVSQREIQAMLEKNEAALRGWNALHKQQPATSNPTEHKEWVKRCVTFRQQIGARLEVLASIADKQIAQEDEKSDEQKSSTNSAAVKRTETLHRPTMAAPSVAASQAQQQFTLATPQQMYAPSQVSTMSMSMGLASMAMPNVATLTPPTMFPEPPIPTGEFASTSSNMFFTTGQMYSMQNSAGYSPTTSMAVSGVTISDQPQGYLMSSGVQTFTPNAYMTSNSRLFSSFDGFINQQDCMMGNGMINSQQQEFMSMPMPMSLPSSGGANMYGYNSYGMPSAPVTNIHSSGNGNIDTSTSNFPVDPFITPLGFTSDQSYGSSGYPMANLANMHIQHQQHQVMGSTNGVNFGAPMMPNNFGYGPSIGPYPSSPPQSMMSQSMPTHQFQPTLQPFQQQNQPTQQIGAEFMSLSADSGLYGDHNVNIFEGLTDDSFFPMQ
ncbi:hypothetical protein KXD40_002075 [Peronospora effusa]|uniref:Uncharacterized protein n=1 Tax=Peronospora effusa TaxID=542832 RepID=A0A3M6VK29_9STRA|nr:hypothetical protein DD238_002103 [Peronospora effusa]RQM18284.1 hypothetical protein DD237_000108 [Peronospora effusa]UIZ26797.1 hypothetical protein KXD40_002075 [Peronospora effusa]CAI5725650.1 unnamed protein product [Peronospora effusa]